MFQTVQKTSVFVRWFTLALIPFLLCSDKKAYSQSLDDEFIVYAHAAVCPQEVGEECLEGIEILNLTSDTVLQFDLGRSFDVESVKISPNNGQFSIFKRCRTRGRYLSRRTLVLRSQKT